MFCRESAAIAKTQVAFDIEEELSNGAVGSGNMDSKRGEFAENSMFAEELRSYFRGQREFIDLSVQVAEYIVGELGRMEKTESADLLVIDFEDDPDNTVREMTDEEAEAAYEARGKRYFAFMLLEAKQAYMHEVGYGESEKNVDLLELFSLIRKHSVFVLQKLQLVH